MKNQPWNALLAGMGGMRPSWDQLPPGVRLSIEEHAGSRVETAQVQHHGFSPGLAARLRLANGRHLFVKAIGPDECTGAPGGQDLYRREAEVASQLPPTAPAPTLVDHWKADEWVALLFEDVDGANPVIPWQRDQLERVLEELDAMARTLTPSPLLARSARTALGASHWQELARDEQKLAQLAHWSSWAGQHLALLEELELSSTPSFFGETLLHFDLRADNIVLTSSKVYVVDWPHVAIGSPWVDLALFLPSVAMQGGPAPQELFWRHPLSVTASQQDLARVLACFTGYMLEGAMRPPPPGLPKLRQFQLAQGLESTKWLAQLL